MLSAAALLAGLVTAVLAATAFLIRRDRARSSGSDDFSGVLIERAHTAAAARSRSAFTSGSVHHGGGAIPGDQYRP
ncbi:hypothetical protein ACIRBX_27105 [Kitasatospora sp. NPDC096147]|uniref:hypothetical protein n=1 Tax=Kitasatospora sp. NPDC096147 TaxID=3364093 RepID=UPI00381DE991